jgi:hypothetical protein
MDSTLRDTLSKGSVENTQLLHHVVEESALEQLGGDEACKQGMETHTGEAGQLEDGEKDHGNEEQRSVLCQDDAKRVCVTVLAVNDAVLIIVYHGQLKRKKEISYRLLSIHGC